MGKLLEDIISTADSYASKFSEVSNFDYSIHSLKAVDEHLEEMRRYELSEEGIDNISSLVGCYVFETARKNYGGEYRWAEEEQQPVLIAGLPDFSVSLRVWEKIRGRLINGADDNIPFYIEGYKEHIEKGKSKKGYNVRII